MPVTNPSKISAYMAAVKADLEANVTGIGEVTALDRFDMADVMARAKAKASGQVVWIVFVGASNPDGAAMGPRLRARFQIQIFDHPALRRKTKRHGWEIAEDVMGRVHGANFQQFVSSCRDSQVSGLALEVEGNAANVYVVQVETTLQLTQTN